MVLSQPFHPADDASCLLLRTRFALWLPWRDARQKKTRARIKTCERRNFSPPALQWPSSRSEASKTMLKYGKKSDVEKLGGKPSKTKHPADSFNRSTGHRRPRPRSNSFNRGRHHPTLLAHPFVQQNLSPLASPKLQKAKTDYETRFEF
jgi:hypothetical protein